MTEQEKDGLKNKYLPYYKKKYESHFSPALLNYHSNKLFEQAVKTYDPSKSQFQTHLSFYMSKMNRVANNKGSLVKETEYFKTHKNEVLNTYHEMKTIQDKAPTPLEISKKTGVPQNKVKEILASEFRVSIVPGVDTKQLEIEPNTLLYGLNKDESKVLDTISKNMPPDKAYKYTGLSKTIYYEKRKDIQKKLKQAYIKHLRDFGNGSGN
jgi:hypothetical protein